MNLKQVLGMFLLIAGVGAFIYGLSIQDSIEYKFVSAFGGDTSRVVLLMIGGTVVAIVGVLLLVFGRDKKSEEVRPVRPAGQTRQSEDALDVRQFDDGMLTQIAESDGMYRPDVVEASRRELELRRKCAELLPQVREKDDDQLREMTGNPALYTEELIRTARMVQEERQRLWLEEQERAEQAARLEREKLDEERRQLRIAARKRRRPYVLAVLVLLVLAGSGSGYYAYRQKQKHLAMERRAAEERYAAELKRAEEERAAERQRQLEAEKQAREAEEQARNEAIEAKRRQAAAAEAAKREIEERHKRGVYRVGEYYEAGDVRGVVFSTDETGQHGKILSVKQEEDISWDLASDYYEGWALPSMEEIKAIMENKAAINKALKRAGHPIIEEKGYWLEEHRGGIVYYYGYDGQIYNCTKTDVRSQPYEKHARWVRKY